MNGLLQELTQAWRGLRRGPGFLLAVVATLAIGIGSATSLYAFVRAALSDLAPHIEDIASVGRVYASSRALGVERAPLSLDDFQLLAGASSFESIAAYTSGGEAEAPEAQNATVSIGQVSAGFFTVLGARAAAGRLLLPHDFRDGAPVVVVSDHIWRTHFGGRTVGEATLTLDGAPRTIVGVLQPEFGFPFIGIGADAWVPMRLNAAGPAVSVIGRLTPDRAWPAAQEELAALARPQHPNGVWTWRAIPVEADIRQRAGGASALMLGPALVVLLIGCVNVACMLFARGIERDVELSVRSALGATRGRIARQLIMENLLLATAGGALGGMVAVWMLRAVASQVAQFQPAFAARITGDMALLPTAFGFSAVACVLFGTLPTIRLSRRDIARWLKGETAPAAARFVGYGARDLVVFVELGLAVVLIVVAAMWLKLFWELQRVTPLFPAGEIVGVSLPARDIGPAMERIASLPGVAGVAVASGLPGGRSAAALAEVSAGGRTIRASVIEAGPSLFHTIGLPVLRGRSFDAGETNARAGVVVVSEGAAALLWPVGDPVGARLTIARRTGTTTAVVIGVCKDGLSSGSLQRAGIAPADIYVPFDLHGTGDALVLARSATDAHLLVRPVSQAVRASASASAPRARVLGDDEAFVPRDSVALVRLIAAFALVALVLASTGVFGVVSQSVSQRTTEFGVRMAMGASSGQVLRMVLGREARLIAAAIGAGAVGTVGVTRVLWAELVTFSATDPQLWLAVMLLCAGLAAVAAVFATFRIVRMDPWLALRRS